MPQIPTKYFGDLEYRDADVVHFPCGLPAFEEERQFLVLDPPERAPLQFLQSLNRRELCFLMLPILIVDPDYHLSITAEDLTTLDLEPASAPAIGSEIECLAMVVSPDNGPPSVNLLAPIVINKKKHYGVQAIRVDSIYSHQHSLAGPEVVCS